MQEKFSRFFCSYCRAINKKLTLTDRTDVCRACGKAMDRDVNDAINVDQVGIAQP